jgi:SAM-dependent methyltransferase
MTDKWFEDWFNSPYYHQLYAHRDTNEAASFIEKLVAHLKPVPNANLLDVACGKGRHSKQLASYGFDVTGFDLSTESIAEAKKMECEHLHFFVNDIREPLKENYFDIAFNFFTSFGYFESLAENELAIAAIVTSIKNEGVLVMDYLNIKHAESTTVADQNITIDNTTYQISKWNDDLYFYKKILIHDSSLTEPLCFYEKVRKFTLDEFTLMFEKNGLQILETFGDYHFANYQANTSPRLILIAKKQ